MPKPRRKDKGKASEKPAGDTTSGEEDSDSSLVDILLELKSFRAETSKNFSEIKKEIYEIKEDVKQLKARVGTAEERIAENQSRNIEMTQVLIQVLRKQKLLEEKCDDIESRSRRKNLHVYSVPEKAEGNTDGKIKVFESPEAAEGLQEFGIAMECPTKELDLESILQAAGWQSPRSKSRTGHIDNLMPSLKKLLQPTSASQSTT
uniref:Uncharacterized protein n=1 Tax=Knipowitschia caucasica TaxID=637954 RepID=A0AAV2LJA9_KNICA